MIYNTSKMHQEKEVNYPGNLNNIKSIMGNIKVDENFRLLSILTKLNCIFLGSLVDSRQRGKRNSGF